MTDRPDIVSCSEAEFKQIARYVKKHPSATYTDWLKQTKFGKWVAAQERTCISNNNKLNRQNAKIERALNAQRSER